MANGSVVITSCSASGQPGASATVSAVVRSGYGMFNPGDVIHLTLLGDPVTTIVLTVTRNGNVVASYTLPAPYTRGSVRILAG